MDSVGLRDLRLEAPEVLRRVEAGERIEVVVSGRRRAVLVPAETRRWRSWTDVAEVFEGPADPEWGADREQDDQQLRDPRAGR